LAKKLPQNQQIHPQNDIEFNVVGGNLVHIQEDNEYIDMDIIDNLHARQPQQNRQGHNNNIQNRSGRRT
uniref:Uncharacterized protein n=1 Tax=Meloidogyne floridensis TaxID=298350 RepID=A0A915NCL1_9BILA